MRSLPVNRGGARLSAMTRADVPPRVAARDYSRPERIADATIHVAGLVLALAAGPALVVAAALLDGRGAVVASVAVYVAALLGMLGASAAYNILHGSTWREVLRRLDHAAIYLKIAATQTPFAVLVGAGPALWALGSVWTAAILGAAAKLAMPGRLKRVSLPLYLLLGWAGMAIVFSGDAETGLSSAALVLIVVGGLLYTLGTLFFVAERLPYHNAVWHGFVLAASLVFYAAVATELGLRATAPPLETAVTAPT